MSGDVTPSPSCRCPHILFATLAGSPLLSQPGGPLLLGGHHIDAELSVDAPINIVHCSPELLDSSNPPASAS
jgi:hypothetical protein